MIGMLIEALRDVRAETETIDIAKGKNELPDLKEMPNKIKQIWRKKK